MSELFDQMTRMTLENARQIRAEVSLQLILKQLDVILGEINSINDKLRENQCANLKL
jgi:hypothetical protein